MTHPCDDIRSAASSLLADKTIVLGVTGSIAAVETVTLARELIRHGAEIIPVMTESACRILHPDALWFATGNRPVTTLTGDVEHVQFCGQHERHVDMLLVAPCTANTLSKIALGIDDTSVTTFGTTAAGSGIPILLVPAMHAAMYDNPFVMENLERCKNRGIHLLEPHRVEGKAKMASRTAIVAAVIRYTGRRDWTGQHVLIIGGSTTENIDPVRIITNRSSGKTALALAIAAYHRGADVELWHHGLHPPDYLFTHEFTTHDDLVGLIDQAEHYDCIVNCAAITDFTSDERSDKISSQTSVDLHLTPVQRINPLLRKHASTLVGFKLEMDQKRAADRGWETLQQDDLDYIVANTADTLESDSIQACIIDRKHDIHATGGVKSVVADALFDLIV